MANIINDIELAAVREDMKHLIGFGYDDDESQAQVTVNIKRETALGAINTTTLLYSPSYTTIYEGPAIVAPIIYRRERTETAGQEAVRIRNYRVTVPWDAGDIHRHDIVTPLTAKDPNMVGREFNVVDVIYTTNQGARRITVQDVADT